MLREKIALRNCKVWIGSAQLPDLKIRNFLLEVQLQYDIIAILLICYVAVALRHVSILLTMFHFLSDQQVLRRPRMPASK